MKIVQINATCGVGSTGKICLAVSRLLNEKGVENYVLYTGRRSDADCGINYADKSYLKLQALKSRIFGNYGFNSGSATKRLINHLDEIKPDIVHLHNLHGHNADLKRLFEYFKKNNTKLFWTFHDCFAFTGYCTHFLIADCNKWESTCQNCPQSKSYSWFFDKSKNNFNKKKKLFSGLDLTIITPSEWLKGLVERSFLKDYPVKVVNNGIDLETFKLREDFREKYKLPKDKTILLGVSFGWSYAKGIDVFCKLYQRLDKEKYQIVLVGTDQKTEEILPEGIITIRRTENQKELAEIYSSADFLINPTREETYPTVNMEAIASGCPVITFDAGGSPEMLTKESGVSVKANDVDAIEKSITEASGRFDKKTVAECGKVFDDKSCFESVINMYKV